MDTKSLVLFIIIFALTLQPVTTFAATSNQPEQPVTAVRISPAQIENMQPGDSFVINVSTEESPHLENTDIYAFQVDIHFDPGVLKVVNIQPTSISEFPLIVKNESNLFDDICNLTYNGPTFGQIYYVASRCDLVSSSFVNGGILLFTVTFAVISYGSSNIQLTQYTGSGSDVGTYFMTSQGSPTTGYAEIVPKLDSAVYGNLVATPTAPTPPDNSPTVLGGQLLPFLIPFAFVIVLLGAIRRKMKGKKETEPLPSFSLSF